MNKNNLPQVAVVSPLFHLVKRDAFEWWKAWIVRIIAVFCALIVCGIVTISLTDIDPVAMYKTMIDGAIGTPRLAWNLYQNTALLLCVALAVTPAFKMKFTHLYKKTKTASKERCLHRRA